MKHYFDRILSNYDGSDWLLQRKAKTFLFLNAVVIGILLIEIIISSLLLGQIAPEFFSNLFISIGLSLLMYPLFRGNYHLATSFGLLIVLVGISWTRYSSTGVFSTDVSYDFLQYTLDLILLLFYANLIARHSLIITATFIVNTILLGVYAYILPTYFHAVVTPATQSVFFSGFLFLVLAGMISVYTFLQNKRAIDVANQESKASRESERNYREIFNSTSEAIFIHDAITGQILDVNDAMIRMYGFETKEQAIQHSIGDLSYGLPPYTEKEAQQNILKALGSGTQTFEWQAKKNNGKAFWVEVALQKTEIGGKGRVLAVVRDVTDRKHIVEALRENEQRFRAIVESVPDALFIAGQDGQFITVNNAACEQLQYTKTELLQMNVFDIVAQNEFPLVTKRAQNLGSKGDIIESHHVRKDGTLVPVELSLIKLMIDGKPAMLGVARDITERKLSEDALRHAQKMEGIGTLAGGIAHDFNNLLNAILGQSSLALNKISNDNPAHQNILKTIKASERAADLTRQLLAYSGRGKFFTEDIDLNTLVSENVQMLEVSVPKTTRLQFDLGQPSPWVLGDIGQLQQVIMNLIINAGEAIGQNPGSIMVRTGQIEITQNSKEYWKYTNTPLQFGHYAFLQVTDTGSGISQNALARIFDPFFTTKFTGRGLGLAAVLGIIRGHNGGLRIESEEGKGATFEVVLPLVHYSDSSNVPLKQNTVNVEGKGISLLVIDDDPFVLELLKDILTEAHFTVFGIPDPIEGINFYREKSQEIEIVILDYSMPGMDGKTAFEELFRINKNVKVLLCSGYTEEETYSAFGTDKPAGFFQKPYKPEALLERVSQMILKKVP